MTTEDEQRVYKFTARMPPRRQYDVGPSRAEQLAEALAEPGNWSSDIVVKGKVVTWTFTIPDHVRDLHWYDVMQDTADKVGYHCSDTIGPRTRKAILSCEGVAAEYVCRGSW